MTDFDHHYKIQKNAGFRLGHSLISAFFCDLWILLFVQPIVNNRYIDLSDLSYTAPMWQILNFHCTGARLKNHSRNLYAPLCGMFRPNSVAVACYDALIRTKSPTKCDAHLAENLFQTRSRKVASEQELISRRRQNSRSIKVVSLPALWYNKYA